MKKAILLLIFITNLSCSQKKNQIMEKEKLLNIYKEIEVYDYNPRYWIDIRNEHCSYEILLNDVPINSYFGTSEVSGGSMPLNSRILAKGKQKLSIKIYPYISDNKMPENSLEEQSKLSIKISYGEYGKEKAKDYHQVTTFLTPTFNGSIPFYETILYFEASKIPYNIQGWLNSVDLTDEDKDKLKIEVENIYEEISNFYINKEVNKIYGLYYKREKEIAQSLFFNKQSDSEELVQKIEKDVNKDIPFKLEKYEMKIFGNGKIVGLIRTDIPYRGASALFFENDERYSYYSILLHRPKLGAPLEVIR